MDFSKEQILRLATLGRLRLNEEELERYQNDLNAITGYVEKLSELDVSDVEPMTHVAGLSIRPREDEVVQRLSHEQVLSNAPDTAQGQFRVPKVVSDS